MSKLLAGAAGALAFVLPAAGRADVVTLRAAGTAVSGLDQTGVLGAPGLLAGRPFTLTLRYDTALAPPGAGGVFADAAAWFSLELEGEGAPFGFAGQDALDRYASVELIEDGANDQFNLLYEAAGLDGEVDYAQSLALSLVGDFFASTADLPLFDGPLAIAGGSADFTIDDLTCAGSACEGPRRADGGLAFTAASGVVGVPEPSAWALMIAGFGLAGAMLRRRARVAA
jgi:hypothetical protein